MNCNENFSHIKLQFHTPTKGLNTVGLFLFFLMITYFFLTVAIYFRVKNTGFTIPVLNQQ